MVLVNNFIRAHTDGLKIQQRNELERFVIESAGLTNTIGVV